MVSNSATAPAWFTPGRYSELRDFTHQQWASLLNNRLHIEVLLRDWEDWDHADHDAQPVPADTLDEYDALRGALEHHFDTIADTTIGLLGRHPRGVPLFPNVFLNSVPPPIRPLTVGEAVMLTPEIAKRMPDAISSIESLQSVLDSGFVLEASGTAEPSHIPRFLNSEERRDLGRPVNEGLLVVDLGLDRKQLTAAFAKWIDEVRPGGRACRAKKRLDLAGWVDNGVVPYVDLDQWLRWSRISAGPTWRAAALAAVVGNREGALDAKKLHRTVAENSKTWLSGETQRRLQACVAASVCQEYQGGLDNQNATKLLAARGAWYREGQN